MSNIIRLSETAPEGEWLSMSNQGTDCFLDLLICAADASFIVVSSCGLFVIYYMVLISNFQFSVTDSSRFSLPFSV